MPISPKNMKKYPGGSTNSKEWKAIRSEVLERANHACEGSPEWPLCRAVNYEPHPETGSKVVLTIAHLNHNPSDSDRDNLKAWCQRCHNKYDQPHRQKNAAKTRLVKQLAKTNLHSTALLEELVSKPNIRAAMSESQLARVKAHLSQALAGCA